MWTFFVGTSEERPRSTMMRTDRIDELKEDGFNVKPWNPKADPEDQIFSLRIKIGFDRFPPQVVVIRGGKKIQLTEAEVKMLDWADIDKCDLVVRGRVWDEDTGRRSAWLKSLFAYVTESELAAKYNELEYGD